MGHSRSLDFMIPMIVLNFSLGKVGVYISLRMNEMNTVKYEERLKQTLYLLKKDLGLRSHMLGHHLRCLHATSMIPRSRGYEMYDI